MEADGPLRCHLCDYSTVYRHCLAHHMANHKRSGKFRCPECSYSSARQHFITQHLKRSHGVLRQAQPNLNEATSGEDEEEAGQSDHADSNDGQEEVPEKEQTAPAPSSRKRARDPSRPDPNQPLPMDLSPTGVGSGSDEPTVQEEEGDADDSGHPLNFMEGLLNSAPLGKEPERKRMRVDSVSDGSDENLMAEEEECRKQMATLAGSVEAAFRSQSQPEDELKEKILILKNQMETLNEKVRIGAEEVQQKQVKSDEVRKKLAEAVGRKVKADIAVRLAECEALRFSLRAMETQQISVQDESSREEAETKVQQAVAEAERASAEADALKAEQVTLNEQLEEVVRAHDGACDERNLIQAELEKLESIPRGQEGLKAIQQLVQDYAALEKRLAEVAYKKTLAGVNRKVEQWLEIVSSRFGDPLPQAGPSSSQSAILPN